MITVYGKTRGCVQCDRTKLALDRKGIGYDFIDVTEDETAFLYVTTTLGYQQVPVVETPADSWAGYRPDKIGGLIGNKEAA